MQHDTTFLAAWKRFRSHRAAVISLGILIVITILACLAPWLTPYSYDTQDLSLIYAPPSGVHWLGNDKLGRDVLSRLWHGAQISMMVALLSTLMIVILGTLWGAIAGYFGGWIDSMLMRMVDVFYALPYLFFVIILMMLLGRNVWTLLLAIGALSWLTMARIVRGQVLSLKNKDFVVAARTLGSRTPTILFRHIVPNMLGTIGVYATLTIPRMILLEAFISFLGLGIQEPLASWGSLCNDGVAALVTAPWLIVFPGLVMTITILAFNYLGDGLRDALDPHMEQTV